jgi:hypothetical protein
MEEKMEQSNQRYLPSSKMTMGQFASPILLSRTNSFSSVITEVVPFPAPPLPNIEAPMLTLK